MSEDKSFKLSESLVERIVEICEDVKAVDIKTFNVSKCSSVADFYIICTGNSEPHLKAISERLEKSMKDAELAASVIDGGASSQWIVMDFHGVIVHILHPDAREYYSLETLWDTGQKSIETLPWECKEGDILTSERIFRRH